MTAIVVTPMNVSRPYGPIAHPLDSAVLVVLAGTTRPLTGREVARLAPEGTQQGVWKALRRLADEGLVDREEAGSSSLYVLNREHLATPAVEALVGIRTELLTRLRDAIRGWKIVPVHASLFGSAARGDGDVSSDIDLFIVRPAGVDQDDPVWSSQLDDLADHVRRWTGNRAGISQVAERDIKRLRRERPPVVDELDADAITLAGPDATELFPGKR